MKYFFKSVATFSFWRYALFSAEALAKLLATIGAVYLFMELMDFLHIYTKDEYSSYAIFPITLDKLIAATGGELRFVVRPQTDATA